MNKRQPTILYRILLSLVVLPFLWGNLCFAQTPDELEINLDLGSSSTPLPGIYKTNIDLSGRGAHRDISWPQTLAAKDVLDIWQKDLGFNCLYRIQYNLWEIAQLAKDESAQAKLLENYEEIIKKISDSGGTVILDLFGTPSGLGRVLDKNSSVYNLMAYKELVKDIIRKLSCNKKYNIWYEVWNAPDLEDFFLGEKSEYFALYRVVAEAIKELRQESRIHIPLGGPSTSSWFANIGINNILFPERSLIYELIKYCSNYKLPLDFISWHAYSSDPALEKQETIYGKSLVKLIREWLSYFNFQGSLPLVIDEWNFDAVANISPKRGTDAYIAASYIPARIKNMQESGIDCQTYFCLEDFAGNKEKVARNLGVFYFDAERSGYKGYAKVSYNVMRMLGLLGNELLPAQLADEFVGIISTKSQDYFAVLIYNYIDPAAAINYLSRNIVYLNSAEKKAVLNIVKSDRIDKIISGQTDLSNLRLSPKVKDMFTRAIELNSSAKKFSTASRKIKISFKGAKEIYLLSRYLINSSCSGDCPFEAKDGKEVDFTQEYIETLEMSPYSVQLLVFKKKPLPPPVEVKPEVSVTEEPVKNAENK
ncbi:MAG: cellulase family glycosylhydrolase [Candidatus Omnitrophica bacterium]|nr:cellulase family glycosylhydrolase [Candidatus Omnitrophota bacterium]MDD5690455.1 cellulase family glycosylhydrolase [Candidatus Omnitrophota bacterium]